MYRNENLSSNDIVGTPTMPKSDKIIIIRVSVGTVSFTNTIYFFEFAQN